MSMSDDENLTVYWNSVFLSLSVIVAIIGTYTTQAVIEQGHYSRKKMESMCWFGAGAIVMSIISLWGSNFIVILGLVVRGPDGNNIKLFYGAWLTWASILLAVFGATLAFLCVTSHKWRETRVQDGTQQGDDETATSNVKNSEVLPRILKPFLHEGSLFGKEDSLTTHNNNNNNNNYNHSNRLTCKLVTGAEDDEEPVMSSDAEDSPKDTVKEEPLDIESQSRPSCSTITPISTTAVSYTYGEHPCNKCAYSRGRIGCSDQSTPQRSIRLGLSKIREHPPSSEQDTSRSSMSSNGTFEVQEVLQKPTSRVFLRCFLGNEFHPNVVQVLVGALVLAIFTIGMRLVGLLSILTTQVRYEWDIGMVFLSMLVCLVTSTMVVQLVFHSYMGWYKLPTSIMCGLFISTSNFVSMQRLNFSYDEGGDVTNPDLEMGIGDAQIALIVAMFTYALCFAVIVVISSIASHARRQLEQQRQFSDRLLHTMLPSPIVERIKGGTDERIIDSHKEASIIFADICSFTDISQRESPSAVVDMLHELFSRFDSILDRFHIEKLKQIGDGYMAAAGMPTESVDHAVRALLFGVNLIRIIDEYNTECLPDKAVQIRVGIHSGSVTAGVIGTTRFVYDAFGNTVNVASRMESTSPRPMVVHMSADTARILMDRHGFDRSLFQEHVIDVKGVGETHTFTFEATHVPPLRKMMMKDGQEVLQVVRPVRSISTPRFPKKTTRIDCGDSVLTW